MHTIILNLNIVFISKTFNCTFTLLVSMEANISNIFIKIISHLKIYKKQVHRSVHISFCLRLQYGIHGTGYHCGLKLLGILRTVLLRR